jgi:predicted enzyme related to lactoylglutathione lyase
VSTYRVDVSRRRIAAAGVLHGTAPPGYAAAVAHYVEVVSADADAVVEMYQRTHDVSFGAADPDLGQARVASLPDGTLVGIRKPLADHEQPIVRVYLAVADIEHAVTHAVGQGAVVAYPPTRQGQRGTFAIVIHGGVQHGFWQN